MNKVNLCIICAAYVGSLTIEACRQQTVDLTPVGETLSGPIALDEAPAAVVRTLQGTDIDERYEVILSDSRNDVVVWSLMYCSDEVSSEGYGIVINKGSEKTTIANLRHGRQPAAHYDAATGNLWIIGADMEGTGTLVERAYLLRFDEESKAHIVCSIEPFAMQRKLAERLAYTVDGNLVTLYADGERADTATNTIDDMGAIDDEAVWIGEQIGYHFVGNSLYVDVTPGLKYVNGPALAYDDLPTLTARVTTTDDCGFTTEELKRYVADPFAGKYVSGYDSSQLEIMPREDGNYDIVVDLFRLTLLDDGIGTLADDGIHFRATDAGGQPIEGTITMIGDAARLVFTNSTWDLLNVGDSFDFEKTR